MTYEREALNRQTKNDWNYLSFVLTGIFVVGLSLVGLVSQDAQATEYTVSDEASCLALAGTPSWDGGCIINGTLTLEAGDTLAIEFVTGSFTISGDGTLNNEGAIHNRSLMIVDGTLNNYGTLNSIFELFVYGTLNNYGEMTTDGISFENRGEVNNFGALEFQTWFFNREDAILNNEGTLRNHAIMELWDESTIDNSGYLYNFDYGSFRGRFGGTMNNMLALINTGGSVETREDFRFENFGSIMNLGTDSFIDFDSIMYNHGSILNVDGFVTNRGQMDNHGVIQNIRTFSNFGSFANQGTLNNSFIIINSGDFRTAPWLLNPAPTTNNFGFINNIPSPTASQATITNFAIFNNFGFIDNAAGEINNSDTFQSCGGSISGNPVVGDPAVEECELQVLIDAFDDLHLSSDAGMSLRSLLTQSDNLLNDGDPDNDLEGCSKLDDFVDKADNKEKTGKLDFVSARGLISGAQAVKRSIGC